MVVSVEPNDGRFQKMSKWIVIADDDVISSHGTKKRAKRQARKKAYQNEPIYIKGLNFQITDTFNTKQNRSGSNKGQQNNNNFGLGSMDMGGMGLGGDVYNDQKSAQGYKNMKKGAKKGGKSIKKGSKKVKGMFDKFFGDNSKNGSNEDDEDKEKGMSTRII